MGVCISISSINKASSSSSSSSQTIKNNIRVVHYNGYLENFEDPTTVGQVTTNVPNHFLCTPTQLMLQDLKPLVPDSELKSGHIYFLLPYSTLRFEVSPIDLASISKKLMMIAKTGQSLSSSPSSSPKDLTHDGPDQSSPIRNSQDRGPNRRERRDKIVEVENVVDLGVSMKSQPWKPTLSAIRERSINRGSELDIQEKHLVIK